MAHLVPGILAVQSAYSWQRCFAMSIRMPASAGRPPAVSSTYIILFIIFAAFLQASKVGDYFVNFASRRRACARWPLPRWANFRLRSHGHDQRTSAGNGGLPPESLTITADEEAAGYRPTTAGAVEAAASTGGQIMPPIMGAGASSWPRSPAFRIRRSPSPRSSRRALLVSVYFMAIRSGQAGHAGDAGGG